MDLLEKVDKPDNGHSGHSIFHPQHSEQVTAHARCQKSRPPCRPGGLPALAEVKVKRDLRRASRVSPMNRDTGRGYFACFICSVSQFSMPTERMALNRVPSWSVCASSSFTIFMNSSRVPLSPASTHALIAPLYSSTAAIS